MNPAMMILGLHEARLIPDIDAFSYREYDDSDDDDDDSLVRSS